MDDLNSIFNAFQTDYAHTFSHYGRLKSDNEGQLLYKTFKEVYQESLEHSDTEFAHPRFMREFMGAGILPSFKTTSELRADSKKSVSAPSRIGKSLSTFHHVMRNTGKEWGLYFDAGKLDGEFKAILEWMDNPEAHSRPDTLKNKTDGAIVEDILKRFAAMPEVPIRIPQKYAGDEAQEDVITAIPNKRISCRRVHYGEADSYTETYDIPTAALAWAIRPAGMSIQGRSDGSPMRALLEKVVGIGREAGEKILVLHRAAPDVYRHYDRDAMASSLYDEKAWIKTAEAVEKILGNKGEGYEQALHLVGDSGKRVNVLSAYKVAVLLYAVAERMEKISADGKTSAAFEGLLNAQYGGMGFDELTQQLKDLSVKLYEKGLPTEGQLNVIKRDDIHQPDPQHFYSEHLREIKETQKDSLRSFFAHNLQYSKTVKAFYEVIPELEKTLSAKDALIEHAEFVAEFCNYHMVTRFGHKEAILPHHQRKMRMVSGLE